MAWLKEIRWHGRGGQGVVTAGKLLAESALEAGQYFQAFPDYGPERSGAPIRAFTRLSDGPITLHNQIEEPDVVIVLDPTLLGNVPVTSGLKPDGVLLVNTSESPEAIRARLKYAEGRVVTVDASRIAIDELGKEITNTPMLGAFARATGLFAVAEIVAQTRQRFAKKFAPELVEANVRAVERAAKELREA
ncbi:MAG: 2-oxoacid:acceptor oxidoreductase family protein [Chloroflexi bacterium]|nr:2-oxoacid:acceptor oxidoreductase family protein [Chloroflexota bacterium]MBI3760509.1 2-oxoacid:acceptor oxidoreductase family protein [Chloroflexota bacterium]